MKRFCLFILFTAAICMIPFGAFAASGKTTANQNSTTGKHVKAAHHKVHHKSKKAVHHKYNKKKHAVKASHHKAHHKSGKTVSSHHKNIKAKHAAAHTRHKAGKHA